jgi:tetratricopeptide (TPR) repeat protein
MRRFTFALVLISVLALAGAGGAVFAYAQAEKAKRALVLSSATLEKKTRELEDSSQRLEDQRQKLQTSVNQFKESEDARLEQTRKANLNAEAARIAEAKAKVEANNALKAAKEAVEARELAEANARESKDAVERSVLIRDGLEAFKREEFNEALHVFEKLRDKLVVLQPRALDGAANLTTEQQRQYAEDLGWTLSNIGAAYQKEYQFSQAKDPYEKALVVLEQALPKDSNRPILFDTYGGLALTYHALATNRFGKGFQVVLIRKPPEKGNFVKAEDFFQRALAFQKQHRKSQPSEAAAGHLKLARLYVDMPGRVDDAQKNFQLAIDLLRMDKDSNDLSSDERAALVSASREFGEFYQQKREYDKAINIFNDMITVQEAITVEELVNQGNEIAISYSDLGQIHGAASDAAKGEAAKIDDPGSDQVKKDALKNEAVSHTRKAENAFQVANLLQRTALRLRQMGKLEAAGDGSSVVKSLTADLDELADAYVKLGKLNDAEEIYLSALGYRKDTPDRFESYHKLITFYLDKKDEAEAEKFRKLLFEGYKDKQQSTQYAAVLMRLASAYLRDPNKFSEAESAYQRALVIYQTQEDWVYENRVLYQLGELYLKWKKTSKREQAIADRLKTLTKYFKRLATSSPPKSPTTLATEYLNSIDAAAFLYERNGKLEQAAAAYQQAFDASGLITKAFASNAKVVTAYVTTLDRYHYLLRKLGKPVEAAKVVADLARTLREKQLDDARKETEQAQYSQQQPAPTAP